MKNFNSFCSRLIINKRGCMIWQGASDRDGYGQFTFYLDNKIWKCHRLSYRFCRGKIPDGKIIRHDCDTPACVNPKHLRIGTKKDNTHDMIKRGRNITGDKHWSRLRIENVHRGENHSNSKLNNEIVLEIRRLYLIKKKNGKKKYTQRILSKLFKISTTTMCKIINGISWKHLLIKTKPSE